ncbi:hypothetical protein SUGI_0061630 [Cryptomeria japonica]|nr:hypothetical protein SUGI_0061630 [Cryptomeria japonica]
MKTPLSPTHLNKETTTTPKQNTESLNAAVKKPHTTGRSEPNPTSLGLLTHQTPLSAVKNPPTNPRSSASSKKKGAAGVKTLVRAALPKHRPAGPSD